MNVASACVGALVAMAFIIVLVWGAQLNDEIISEKCRDFGAFKANGVIYECKRLAQADHVGEGEK